MTVSTLTIDFDALIANWQALDAKSAASVETTAVIKADGYGLGSGAVAKALCQAGVRRFFVAAAEEAVPIRDAICDGAEICVFSGHGAGDTDLIRDLDLIPMLNSTAQLDRHLTALPHRGYGVQLDSGMNRLGMEPAEWAETRKRAEGGDLRLVMSHLACADEPDHPMNARQLACFKEMTAGVTVPRALSATGGILLGSDYHFDLVRPGIGLYGGLPFAEAQPVVTVSLPVIQVRDVSVGESVGYGNNWVAGRPSRIATVAAGYADGLHRVIGNGLNGASLNVYADGVACPVVGRVSMDLITVDITDLAQEPEALQILNAQQTVDDLADIAGTIGYEILTSLGRRYQRRYVGG
ncbi:alanine racemase [Thalassobius sp. Cn5-15]|uniref:alanine racemase n=1 Tax=Thalassobius sp. Cn5-15 TaxID=2917763 RepID=UPI001EF344D0|nr:alanine racemase [Thalassobius sp. Cn5-15]MCG7492866.1 alanine racemase [Thalassobius sp. Cn5-15]